MVGRELTASDVERVRPNAVFHGSSRLHDGDRAHQVAVDLHALEQFDGAFTVTVDGIDVTPLIGVHDIRIRRDVGPPRQRWSQVDARAARPLGRRPGSVRRVELAYTAHASAGVCVARYAVATVVEAGVAPPPRGVEGGRR